MSEARGEYNELITVPEWVTEMIAEAEKAGVFETGIEWTNRKKSKWAAVNTSVYGYNSSGLAVIQVRKSESTKWGVDVKKQYFLLGHNENGSLFSHPVESPCAAAAKRSAAELVDYVLAKKVWGVTVSQLAKIQRHGDVGFLPEKLPTNAQKIGSKFQARDSHLINADAVYSDGENVYAQNPHASHTRGQHGDLTLIGIYRVIVGARARVWNFLRPIAD